MNKLKDFDLKERVVPECDFDESNKLFESIERNLLDEVLKDRSYD